MPSLTLLNALIYPFDIQMGFSKKLQHNPLKMTVVAHNLQQFDISYVNVNSRNKNIDLETGQVRNETVPFGDKVMRHFNFGAELVFSDNFQLRGGYNHMRQQGAGPGNCQRCSRFLVGFGNWYQKIQGGLCHGYLFPRHQHFLLYRFQKHFGFQKGKT